MNIVCDDAFAIKRYYYYDTRNAFYGVCIRHGMSSSVRSINNNLLPSSYEQQQHQPLLRVVCHKNNYIKLNISRHNMYEWVNAVHFYDKFSCELNAKVAN